MLCKTWWNQLPHSTTHPLLISTWVLKPRVWRIKLDELVFWFISNFIFTTFVACKIHIQNIPKISLSNSILQTQFFKNKEQINRGPETLNLFAKYFQCVQRKSNAHFAVYLINYSDTVCEYLLISVRLWNFKDGGS